MVGEGDGDGCRSNTLCVLNRNVVVGGGRNKIASAL